MKVETKNAYYAQRGPEIVTSKYLSRIADSIGMNYDSLRMRMDRNAMTLCNGWVVGPCTYLGRKANDKA